MNKEKLNVVLRKQDYGSNNQLQILNILKFLQKSPSIYTNTFIIMKTKLENI